MRQGLLVLSLNRGRYAIGDAQYGMDLTRGQAVEINIGGQWTPGTIEHGGVYDRPGSYAVEDYGRRPPSFEPGYYFEADRGGVCGLTVGMEVRCVD